MTSDRTMRAPARAGGAAAVSTSGRAPPERWPWLAAAPLAWALHEVVSYAGASIACRAGDGVGVRRLLGLPAPNVVVAVVSLVALGVSVLATARLWRWWRAHPPIPVERADPASARAERLRFVAGVAAALGALCTCGVLLAAVATFLRGCA